MGVGKGVAIFVCAVADGREWGSNLAHKCIFTTPIRARLYQGFKSECDYWKSLYYYV